MEEPRDPGSATLLRCPPQLRLDATERILYIQDHTVRFTRTEFRLLAYLLERRDGWVTTADLIRDVFGTHHRPDTPLVRVHVYAVRRKLRAHAAWLESDVHRMLGYRWVGPRSVNVKAQLGGKRTGHS